MNEGSSKPLSFRQSFLKELEFISLRRQTMNKLNPQGVMEAKSEEDLSLFGNPYKKEIDPKRVEKVTDEDERGVPINEADNFDLTGIAMSGGGIRSASVCMGVMQGLDSLSPSGNAGVLNQIDYISAVSGGNYMATSLCVGLKQHYVRKDLSYGPLFPFESKTDSQETPETQHIRHHASFLAPQGMKDLILDGLVVVRGLLSNIIKFSGALLFLSFLFLLLKSDFNALNTPLLFSGSWMVTSLPASLHYFPVSFVFLLLILVYVLLIPIFEKFTSREFPLFPESEGGLRPRSGLSGTGLYVNFVSYMPHILLCLIVSVFVELQPIVLKLFDPGTKPKTEGVLAYLSTLFPFMSSTLSVSGLITLILTIAPFANKLVTFLKSARSSTGRGAPLYRFTAKAILVILGLSVPLLLWTFWLMITYKGLVGFRLTDCKSGQAYLLDQIPHLCEFITALKPWGVYLGLSVILLIISVFIYRPNDNSLHRLYRDRLSRAFLMQRDELHDQGLSKGLLGDNQLSTVGSWKFSSLSLAADTMWTAEKKAVASFTPYLLVNTAINLQSSFLAKRSRKADIFTLGSITCGSTVTGYASTDLIEKKEPGLTFAAGMAISGAAASANMGSATIPALTFSMAALNIRLGYWLPNPKKIATWNSEFSRRMDSMGLYWFGRELFGLINEETSLIHLTDGGHIENLGLYELTKRRCRVIIAVDAEADASMTFSSLIKAELMMRIDHGVRIHLPWPKIAAAHMAASKVMVDSQTPDYPGQCGPHVAIGRIIYSEEEIDKPAVHGVLIYIKSSLTGDENDGIRSYKVRNPDFPHESTMDQFFTEEQFEMYRALGFHMAQEAFTGRDRAEFYDPGSINERKQFLDEVKDALLTIGVPLDYVSSILNQAWTH